MSEKVWKTTLKWVDLTPENIVAVHSSLATDHRLTIQMLEDKLHTDKEAVCKIIIKHLEKKRLCMWFIPRAITVEQWDHATSMSRSSWNVSNNLKFWNKIVTGDESRCFANDPKSKWQSTTCVAPNLPKVKKLCIQKPCTKTMLVAFFDSRGLIHQVFVSADKTINTEYYKGIINQLLKWIARIRVDFHTSNN